MANKLREVFSNEQPEMRAKIKFKDEESQSKFVEALNRLYKTGESSTIDGVEAIFREYLDKNIKYPIIESKVKQPVILMPSKKPVPLTVSTPKGEKTITLYLYYTSTSAIFETAEDSIVSLKLTQEPDEKTMSFTYRIYLERAKSVTALADSLQDTIALLNVLLRKPEDKESDGAKLFQSFYFTSHMVDMLCEIEKTLGLTFDPSKMKEMDEHESEVYELYALLVKKLPLRLNAKLTPTPESSLTMADDNAKCEIGASIELVFVNGPQKYELCGQEIEFYQSCLISNAIVTGREDMEDGRIRVIYGDTDSAPMFISYCGFRTLEEAREEMSQVVPDKKEAYQTALTLPQYITKEKGQFI